MTEIREHLGVLATEINARMEKAETYETRVESAQKSADDHRLAAALQIADARQIAADNGIRWGPWVKKNISRSPDDVKKLLKIGQAPNPALALADMRRKERDRKRRQRSLGSRIEWGACTVWHVRHSSGAQGKGRGVKCRRGSRPAADRSPTDEGPARPALAERHSGRHHPLHPEPPDPRRAEEARQGVWTKACGDGRHSAQLTE